MCRSQTPSAAILSLLRQSSFTRAFIDSLALRQEHCVSGRLACLESREQRPQDRRSATADVLSDAAVVKAYLGGVAADA
jgi:hypothetical protein